MKTNPSNPTLGVPPSPLNEGLGNAASLVDNGLVGHQPKCSFKPEPLGTSISVTLQVINRRTRAVPKSAKIEKLIHPWQQSSDSERRKGKIGRRRGALP